MNIAYHLLLFLSTLQYCLWPIIHYLLSIIYDLLPIAYCLWTIIHYLLSIIYDLVSIIYCILPIAYYLLSIIWYLLSIAWLSRSTYKKCFSRCEFVRLCSPAARGPFGELPAIGCRRLRPLC